jgi:hypothetical protein
VTPRASEYGVSVVDTLNDARDELSLGEYVEFLWFVADVLGRRIAKTWEQYPDRPEGWA